MDGLFISSITKNVLAPNLEEGWGRRMRRTRSILQKSGQRGRGLIYNRCVRTKRGLKRAYATSHANVGIYKNKLDGKICVFPRKLWPMRTNVWRQESGKADVRWWTEARLLIQIIIYIITNSLVLLARHICLKIYKTTYSKLRFDSIKQRRYVAESLIGFNNIF